MKTTLPPLILIRGGGDLASGTALRLFRSGFGVVITEIAQPLAVRRAASFSEAVFQGETQVEGVMAARCNDDDEVPAVISAGKSQSGWMRRQHATSSCVCGMCGRKNVEKPGG